LKYFEAELLHNMSYYIVLSLCVPQKDVLLLKV